jgi:hypothetical protein
MGTGMIRLTALTRILDDEVQLAEAFGLPEITALGDSERQCRDTLQTKAKAILEDPTLNPPLAWFRRRFGSAVELDEIELTFVPPKRQPEWQEPVVLRLPFARWVEDGLHQAWVPAVGVLVYATRAAAVEMSQSKVGAEVAQAELVSWIVARRRRIRQLWKSHAAGVLENRVNLLASLERRLVRAGKQAAALDPQLAALPGNCVVADSMCNWPAREWSARGGRPASGAAF